MKIIKNVNTGKFFVVGKGFTGTQSEATKFDCPQSQIAAAASFGISAVAVDVPADPCIVQNPDGSSYAVYYIRAKSIQNDGSVKAHKRNPSPRRFKTVEEAKHHGARFVCIEKHSGFYVQKGYSPVNAYVNKVTGFTNPEIGKKRLARTAS